MSAIAFVTVIVFVFASSVEATNAITMAKNILGNVESTTTDRNLRGDMETLADEVMKSIKATTGTCFITCKSIFTYS